LVCEDGDDAPGVRIRALHATTVVVSTAFDFGQAPPFFEGDLRGAAGASLAGLPRYGGPGPPAGIAYGMTLLGSDRTEDPALAEHDGPSAPTLAIRDLPSSEREAAVPILVDSFTGIYRWHAKRTLHTIGRVRGAWAGRDLVGVAMLELLDPAVGYVYYLAVRNGYRRLGVGRRLLDDALARFREAGVRVVFAAAEEENAASLRLFEDRGFRRTEPKERSWREGGLGAWGLRSRMMVVSGEVLLGLRLREEPRGPTVGAET
jgi:ribosomal protein S18 acetylase RimI-like enzyme